LNPRPHPGSPAFNNVLAGAPTPVNYRGAFGPNDDWADCWTALSSLGFLNDGKTLVTVTNDITGNTTWYATNTYLLKTVVYVHSNAVLTIEPGTVIKGANTNQLIREGVPKPVSALWVGRGGQLYATGTVERPIIFTYEKDNVNSPFDVPFGTSGQWGGVVICGRAVLNSAQLLAGHNSSPIYDRFEGLTGNGTNDLHLFGGNDDNDNSGALRYVSVRYSGLEFETARELNGLSMGGVGRGTTIEYVEVLGSSDDGFEWWGGTVNTKYLVAAFCEDDDFDTDQGYRGTNQFWFGIKPPWTGSTDSRAFESDGDLYQTAVQTNSPISQWVVYNATLVGRGTNETATALGRAWNARDETAANMRNSIVTEFNTGLLLDSDGLLYFTNNPPEADALNNIWGVVNSTVGANGDFLFSDVTRSNSVENPLLGSISHTNGIGSTNAGTFSYGLNPRPTLVSPALSKVLAGAPTPVSYRGAFNTNDFWAHKWSALYKLGYLYDTWYPQTVVAVPTSPTLTIVNLGNGTVAVSWPTELGFNYQLESRAPVTSSWGNVGSPVPGTGGIYTTSPGITITGDEQYFRVVVTAP
jgi:hypothetical protein